MPATSWWRSHPGQAIWIRIVVGIWLLVVTAILCQQRRWWGLVFIAPAALHFYLAHRIDVQRKRGRAAG